MSKGYGQLNSLELIQAFFGQFEKKLKPQENNSKLKQKTQGFGEILKDIEFLKDILKNS